MKTVCVVILLCLCILPLRAQLAIGDSVIVANTPDCINARSAPSLSGIILKCEYVGMRGRVLAGPMVASGYTWYRIAYADGIMGWSNGAAFNKVVPAPPPPICPVSPADSLRIFALGVASAHPIDTTQISIQLQGFKIVQTVGDSIILIKER